MLRKLLLCGLVFWAVAGNSSQAGEAATVLGLPTPRDPNRPGAVMLHGGGRVTKDAFLRFVELAGGPEARIVIVPSAGYRRADYASQKLFLDAMNRRFSAWVGLVSTKQVQNVEFLTTDNPVDANDPTFVKPLFRATGVWFGGGEQSRLNYRYVGDYPNPTHFQTALREVVERGGIVGGTSAGMAAMPQIMAMTQARDRLDGPIKTDTAHGLGLFDGAIVEQHFDGRSGRLERFTSLLKDSERLDRLAGREGAGRRMIGLASEGSTAIVLQSDRLEVFGNNNAHVFIKSADQSIHWHTLNSGDKAQWKRDAAGSVELVRSR